MLWDKNLECGIPAIDKQHKEIFRRVEILTELDNRERIPEMLDFLGRYVVEHFATEEEMHQKSNYPRASEHKAEHTAFTKTYVDLRNEFNASRGSLAQNLQTVVKINRVVFAWLREHIMGSDKNFAVYYKQAQSDNTRPQQ